VRDGWMDIALERREDPMTTTISTIIIGDDVRALFLTMMREMVGCRQKKFISVECNLNQLLSSIK